MNAFADILQAIVERIPGAFAAVFADWEGESVGEFAREMETLEIQIMGAQWGVVWADLQRALSRARLGGARELVICGERALVLVRSVSDEYYVVLAVKPDGHLAKAMAELSVGVEALRAEM